MCLIFSLDIFILLGKNLCENPEKCNRLVVNLNIAGLLIKLIYFGLFCSNWVNIFQLLHETYMILLLTEVEHCVTSYLSVFPYYPDYMTAL